jgi:hypothetical protein
MNALNRKLHNKFRIGCSAVLMFSIGVGALAAQTSDIGYPSVAAALSAMKSKPGASVADAGWTVVEDRQNSTLWSFTPQGHAAHPSAVRRKITQNGDDVFVEMAIRCEAAKPACDKLSAEFTQLNERMRQDLERNTRRR